MTHHSTPVAAELNRHAGNLRRSLQAIIHQAQGALENMGNGQRPSPYGGPQIFNSSLDTLLASSAAVDALLNLAGSPVLDADVAVSILKDAK